MPKTTIYVRTLHKAAEILGGERALARYLRVPMPELFAWMRPGSVPPPTTIFLKAVDLILHDCDDADQSRAQRLRVAAYHKNWTTSDAR
jgi:hypothetical protein